MPLLPLAPMMWTGSDIGAAAPARRAALWYHITEHKNVENT
jgi:hypothetical protein